jgi:mannosyltransferase OCH1-like enzyme
MLLEKQKNIIPNIIHFIWAGGDNPPFRGHIKIILRWRSANPLFKIWLWVDHSSWSQDIPLLHAYRSDFSEQSDSIR